MILNDNAPTREAIRAGAQTTCGDKSTIAHFEPKIKEITFGHLGPKLFARGLPVIPLRGKVPAINGWTTLPTESQINAWASEYPGANVGVPLGHDSLAAIDVDVYDAALSEKIHCVFSMFHSAPCRIGQAPKRLYLVKIPGLDRKLLSAEYCKPGGVKASRIEVLTQGQQCVLAGIHPDTKKPFTGLDYEALCPEALPVVGLDDVTMLMDLFEKSAAESGWQLVKPRPASSQQEPVNKLAPSPEPRKLPAPSSGRPGDDFNQRGLEYFTDRLLDEGWTPAGTGQISRTVDGQTYQIEAQWLTRPGKSDGVSTSLYTDPVSGEARFHLFSSSVDGLEPGDFLINYAYAALFCESDMRQATAELAREGFGHPDAVDDFSDYAGAEASRLKRKRSAGFRFVSEKELLANGPARPEWLIDGLIQAGTFNTIVAAPRSFKTFFAISLGVSVASGLPWFGRTVKPGPVCFLIGEGHHGFGTRLQAAKLNMDLRLDEPLPLYISSSALAIPDQADAEKLATSLAVIEEAEGEPIRLLVVDTLGRNFGGHDENSAQGMGAFVNNLLDSVSPKTAVVVLHHSGWSDQSRARGSSSLFGATDGEFLLTRKDSVVEVSCRKMKDAPEPEHPLVFRAKNMVISCDDDGPIESLVLEPAGPITVQPVLSATRQRALELLEELTTDDTGVDFEQWHETCAEEGVYVKESSFKRGVAWLERSHFIWNRGARFWIRKMGDLNPPEPKARTDVN